MPLAMHVLTASANLNFRFPARMVALVAVAAAVAEEEDASAARLVALRQAVVTEKVVTAVAPGTVVTTKTAT